MALARRLLDHYQAGTTDMAPDIMRQTMDAYLDEERWAQEVDKILSLATTHGVIAGGT